MEDLTTCLLNSLLILQFCDARLLQFCSKYTHTEVLLIPIQEVHYTCYLQQISFITIAYINYKYKYTYIFIFPFSSRELLLYRVITLVLKGFLLVLLLFPFDMLITSLFCEIISLVISTRYRQMFPVTEVQGSNIPYSGRLLRILDKAGDLWNS